MSQFAIDALKAIREIADGRRHYEGQPGCFEALGEIRAICDKVPPPPGPKKCPLCLGDGYMPKDAGAKLGG